MDSVQYARTQAMLITSKSTRTNSDSARTPCHSAWTGMEYVGHSKDLHGILANSDFSKEFDCAPYHEYETKNKNNHQYHNVMSGNWAWKEVVSIYLSYIVDRDQLSSIEHHIQRPNYSRCYVGFHYHW